MTNLVDFAPGENHIALRKAGKVYYSPELFHLSTTFGTITELLINDINKAEQADRIYGAWGYYNRNTIIVNNHPVKKIKIFGKIIGEIYRQVEATNYDYVILTLDDNSGSTVKVKVLESKYTFLGLSWGNNYGKIIECSGILQGTKFQGSKVLLPDFIEIIGKKYDFDIELKCWNSRIQTRLKLQIPWEISPALDTGGNTIVSNFEPIDQLRYDAIRNMKWCESIPQGFANDSYPIYKNKGDIKNQEVIILDREYDEPNEANLRNHGSDANDSNEGDKEDIVELESETDTSTSTASNLIIISSQEIGSYNATSPIEDSLPLNKSRMQVSFDDIQIIEVNDEPLYYINEFELTLQFVRWIMDRNCEKMKLADIYNDLYIHELLHNLTQVRIACTELSKNESLSFNDTKKLIFHRIRHNLHVSKLIQVTKSQTVHCFGLNSIQNDLKTILINEPSISILDFKQKCIENSIISDIDIKLLNGIIDYVLTENLNQRTNWKYDLKSKTWSKQKSRQNSN